MCQMNADKCNSMQTKQFLVFLCGILDCICFLIGWCAWFPWQLTENGMSWEVITWGHLNHSLPANKRQSCVFSPLNPRRVPFNFNMTLADTVLIIVTDSNLVTLYCRARKQNKFYQYVVCGQHKSQPSCSETDPWATMALDQFKQCKSLIYNREHYT